MTKTAGEPIIICNAVNKWFGEFHVLRDVSVNIAQREVVVVIGPSGSGKSTFIRCINRLEEHQEGDIIVDGIPLGNDIRNIAAIRREIGMVFQQFNLFPHLTVMQNISLAPMQVRRVPRVRPRRRPSNCLSVLVSRSRPRSIPVSSPAVSSSAWRSRGRWRWSRRSCCSMSQRRPSTRR